MKPETMHYIFKVCREYFKARYLEMLLIQSPSFSKDNVNTYLEVQTFQYHSNAQDWWRKRVYIYQINNKRMRKWFCVTFFSAITETWSKNDNVCIHLYNIYNAKVLRDSFWTPASNPSELGALQKQMDMVNVLQCWKLKKKRP